MSYNFTQMRNNIQQMEDLRVRIVNLSKDVGTSHDGIILHQIQNSIHELKNLNISFKDQIDQMKRNKDKTREFYQIQAEFVDLNRRIAYTINNISASVLCSTFNQSGQLNESKPQQSSYSTSKRDHSIELQTTPLLDQSMNNQYMNDQHLINQSMIDQYMNDQHMIDQCINNVNETLSLFERTMIELDHQRKLIIMVDDLTLKTPQYMKIENEQLDKPSSHKSGSRKALCVIFIFIIIVALGIGVFFLIQYFRKDKKKRED